MKDKEITLQKLTKEKESMLKEKESILQENQRPKNEVQKLKSFADRSAKEYCKLMESLSKAQATLDRLL